MSSDPRPPDIPLCAPWLGPEEACAIQEVLTSGWIAQGPVTRRFEEAVAAYVGARHAVAVSSGTAALHLSLLALDVGPEDEVIIPSLSFVSTAASVLHAGARPVFAEVLPGTCTIDPMDVENVLSSRTRAICPVHQVGVPADMDPILDLARKHKVAVYEDAACALGSIYRGRRIGAHSDLVCFSFHPRKVITTAEGGMITTNSKELADRIRALRQHGMEVDAEKRHKDRSLARVEFPQVGFNYRMTDIQAAMGLVQMDRLDAILARRREIARVYDELLAQTPHLRPLDLPFNVECNYQSYVVWVLPSCPLTRDELVAFLRDEGIAASVGVGSIHREKPYLAHTGRSLAMSEKASDETLMLPIYPQMTDETVRRVAKALFAAMEPG